MSLSWRALCGGVFLAVAADAHAAVDDLDRIPEEARAQPPAADAAAPGASAWNDATFLELQAERLDRRDTVVPTAAGHRPASFARAKLDTHLRWMGRGGVGFVYSGRLAGEHAADGPASGDSLGSDLREAYLEWSPHSELVLQLGRVNLRSGAAMAFNPTDYLRERSGIRTTTRDPSVLRVDRLGTFMADARASTGWGSLRAAIAPRLRDPGGLAARPGDFNPQLGATNGSTRLLLGATTDLGDDLSPDWLLMKTVGGPWRFGGSLTRGVGKQVTLFEEWSVGRRASLSDAAIRFGIDHGDLPPEAAALAGGGSPTWRPDVALGGTWTGENDLSLTLEVDYAGSGFTRAQWDRWLSSGSTAQARAAGLPGELWYVRDYAQAFETPLSRTAVFARAQWDRAIWRDLTILCLMSLHPDDGSFGSQLELDFQPGAGESLRLLWIADHGRPRSQFGSDPTRQSVLFSYAHYF